MKVFIDECVTKDIMPYLTGRTPHQFIHILDTTLRSTKNGELLRAVAPDFDVFLTTDKNIQYQQNLAKFQMAFLILRPRSNDIADLLPLLPETLATLNAIESNGSMPGTIREIVPNQA